MIVWIDAQLPPRIANWLSATFAIDAIALRDLGLRDATDPEIFVTARQAAAALMTKDSDFVELVGRLSIPPQVIWITSGNTSNAIDVQIMNRGRPPGPPILGGGKASQAEQASPQDWGAGGAALPNLYLTIYRLREILSDTFSRAIELLLAGEKIVEIREATTE
jgi:predicted nuclease of predicted toxin-antitoxin system